MEESTCYEMVMYLSQSIFDTFFINSKYDFHVDAESLIVKTREM